MAVMVFLIDYKAGQTYCDSPSWVIPFGIDPTQTYYKLIYFL